MMFGAPAPPPVETMERAGCTMLAAIEMRRLISVNGYVSVNENPALAVVDLRRLESVGDYFLISSNAKLDAMDVQKLVCLNKRPPL